MNSLNIKKLLKGNKMNLLNIANKNFFIKSDRQLVKGLNTAELPEEGTLSDNVLSSRRTYTKWFNPSNFDPRTPDYVNSVKSSWEDDVTREDLGSGKIILFSNLYKSSL